MTAEAKAKKKEQKKPKKEEKYREAGRLKEMISTLQRVQADFENYKKRVEKEKSEFTRFASSNILSQLLPILDNFSVALKNTLNHDEFVKGIEMIYSQFFSVLEKAGLKPIDADGKKFNPYVHEALMQEESDLEEGMIIEEFQKGYMLYDTVLRNSKVKVSKGKGKTHEEKREEKEEK